LKRGGVILPPATLVGLRIDGEELRFNHLIDTAWNRGRFDTCRYEFAAFGPFARIEGSYSCRPEDMVRTEYADPDGEPAFCHNTEVADLRLTVYRRGLLGRFREAARLYAAQTGHFEVASRMPDPAITHLHRAV
jgi:hypothetical protein